MCTTMIITKGASADGSMMVAHSDDDELSDQRVIYVPAADHKRAALWKFATKPQISICFR